MHHTERLLTEQQNLRKNRKYMFYAIPLPTKNTSVVWECGFPGPDTDPYRGSYFTVQLTFHPKYPIQPPAVKFVSPMYHPNVYQDGSVCLDIISSKWKPSMNVQSVLCGMQTFLEYPNIKSPANANAGHIFAKDRAKYDQKVREMIALYHSKPNFRKM